MSRLIDADKLLDDMKKELEKAINDENLDKDECMVILTSAIALKDFVNRQPTAFDVEKVVEQLEEQISKHDLLFNKYVKDKDKDCSWSISELNKIRGLLDAIEIVKAGD